MKSCFILVSLLLLSLQLSDSNAQQDCDRVLKKCIRRCDIDTKEKCECKCVPETYIVNSGLFEEEGNEMIEIDDGMPCFKDAQCYCGSQQDIEFHWEILSDDNSIATEFISFRNNQMKQNKYSIQIIPKDVVLTVILMFLLLLIMGLCMYVYKLKISNINPIQTQINEPLIEI